MSLPALKLKQISRAAVGYAEVNGTRLYYETQGEGPPLLLLHGFGLDHRLWRAQVAELARRHLVVSYDARGFGRSANPGTKPYSHFADAAALCQHLGVGPVLAVGHASGAHQLLEMALARPGLVSGLVLVNPTGLGKLALPPDLARLERELWLAARTTGVSSARRLWAASAPFRSARENPRAQAAFEELVAGYSGWHWTHENTERGLETPAALQLDAVHVPTLVVTGGLDVAYHDSVGRALVRGIAGARSLELPHVGHLTSLEDPEALTQAILDLCDEAAPQSTQKASGFF